MYVIVILTNTKHILIIEVNKLPVNADGIMCDVVCSFINIPLRTRKGNIIIFICNYTDASGVVCCVINCTVTAISY